MKFSTSLLAATGAALVLSLGLKAALLAAPAAHALKPSDARGVTLGRFLAANAQAPVEPVAEGYRFTQAGCRLMAFPSGERGSMDMDALTHAHGADRVVYVYRGRLLPKPPIWALGLDVLAYMAAKPFRGGA